MGMYPSRELASDRYYRGILPLGSLYVNFLVLDFHDYVGKVNLNPKYCPVDIHREFFSQLRAYIKTDSLSLLFPKAGE